jgi:hypothetical protein
MIFINCLYMYECGCPTSPVLISITTCLSATSWVLSNLFMPRQDLRALMQVQLPVWRDACDETVKEIRSVYHIVLYTLRL